MTLPGKKPMPNRLRLVFLVLIVLAAATAVTATILLLQGRGGPSAGSAARVGGPFNLVNQDGKRVTEADFAGRYRVMFFGFTNCPDVCPATLQLLADTLVEAPELAEQVSVVLVSVDPARDTPEALKDYVTYFDPRFQGLTGTPEEIGAMLKAYGVYAKKVPLPDSAMGYTMDHSSFIYLYGPDGNLITAYDPKVKPADLAAKLKDATG